ncbi:MAG: cardiolipin synthase [Clostridia bacterium]|nr:cardiolipin synthase [Clostridia bacterium]
MRKLCRVLFSRYAVSLLFIVADVLFLTLLALYLSSLFQTIALFLLLLFDAVMLLHLINRDTAPENKLPWAVIILSLPVLGALLYHLFFSRKLSRRERKHMKEMSVFHPSEPEHTAQLDVLATEDASAAGKAMAILREDKLAMVYRGTRARYFDDGRTMFDAMVEDIRAAKRYIFIETFILEEGVMWGTVHAILKEKVAQGLQVRLLYDDIGCMKTLPRYYDHSLRAEGIDVHRFAPVSPRVTVAHNNRDHRKIVVVDGEVAYTGGINFADEYIHERIRFGHWKDGGVRIEGEAVDGLLRLFLVSYNLTTFSMLDAAAYRASNESVPTVGDDGYYIPFGSGPVPLYDAPVGKNAFLNIISQAERYVYVTTPYLIMDFELTQAFCNAAKRGVDVRIMTPHVPDKKLIFLLTRSAYPSLIEAGVRIFEYTPGFLHEKLLVSDDLYSIVGTINLDYRSFAHHFEDAVWMYRSSVISVARDSFMQAQQEAKEIEKGDVPMTLFQKLLRNIIRLFAPLL